MRVLVAGAGGVIGRPLVRLLSAAGHEVVALSRSAGRLEQLRAAGAEPVSCDALDAAALAMAVEAARPDVVVNQLTALPPRLSPRRIGRDLAATNRLRTQGTRNLMTAAAGAGAGLVVAQSVAFAYAPDGDDLRRESDPLYLGVPGGFAEAVAAVADLERETRGHPGMRGAVLRCGFSIGQARRMRLTARSRLTSADAGSRSSAPARACSLSSTSRTRPWPPSPR